MAQKLTRPSQSQRQKYLPKARLTPREGLRVTNQTEPPEDAADEELKKAQDLEQEH